MYAYLNNIHARVALRNVKWHPEFNLVDGGGAVAWGGLSYTRRLSRPKRMGYPSYEFNLVESCLISTLKSRQ